MNAYVRIPRVRAIAYSLILVALFASACSGILPEQVNVPPAQAVQSCAVGNPDAVVVDGKKYDCDDVKNAMATLGAPAPASPVATGCPPYNEKGWPLTEVTPSGTCIYTSLETTAPAADTPAPSDGGESTTTTAGACEDGKVIGNQYANLNRVPVGTAEGTIVAELSWTGSGFGGYDRAVVIVPKLDDTRYAIHVLNPKTVHEVQYCGADQAIDNWAPTHVDAMVITAQANDGSRPDPNEIGVYRLNFDGRLTEIRPGPKGPGLDAVQQRLVVSVTP